MGHVIGIALMLLLAAESISALPQGDGLATGTIPSSSVNPSVFSWVSTWATETTGTDSVTYTPYLNQQSQSQATHTPLVSLHVLFRALDPTLIDIALLQCLHQRWWR
jgi:hypothetical protein